MRKFECHNCGHTWEIPHGEGGRGAELKCPQCGSDNVHRVGKKRGQGLRHGAHRLEDLMHIGGGWRRGWRHHRGPNDGG